MGFVQNAKSGNVVGIKDIALRVNQILITGGLK